MAMLPPWFPVVLVFFSLLSRLTVLSSTSGREEAVEEKRTFIVLVDPQSKPLLFPSHLGWYRSLLPASSSSLIHVYETLLHGFTVPLTPSQASRIEKSRGILAVQLDALLHPHTTRSPSFLGLDPPASRLSALSRGGSDTVIGVVDTGIWPEHPSFSDRDLTLSPAPRRWRGECEEGPGFNRSNCNRKLIGARSFSAGYAAAFGGVEFRSPRDSDGHGTHVASIAAGAPVAGAGFQGFASGVARGMAPWARIAAYKVCWASGCLVSDVVSALEKAVSDGVDVVSLSIGSSSPAPFYYLDPLAVATFRASLRGVFIAASAGNGGPHPGSIANAPPWITTVGAGTIDRDFPAFVQLGNRERVRGISISAQNHRKLPLHPHQLISVGKITAPLHISQKSRRINGQIVFWEPDRHVSRIDIGAALKQAGAAGTVVFHGDMDTEGILAEPHVIPTVTVGSSAARSIEEYIRSREHPTAVIASEGTNLLPHGVAPAVASFSSRGPNAALPWVLKPDLVAPGVNILGSWTDAIGPSGIGSDIRRSGFSVMSGTSMACPHVSGVAALLRAARPGWGPSEIRSALMTTAVWSPVGDESRPGENAGPFAMGAGHLNPDGALDPGLVYDLEYEDYVGLLCGLNYTDEEIGAMSGGGRPRCKRLDGKGVWGFNHPGFVVEVAAVGKGEVAFYRRLKKVDGGCAEGCWYSAEVAAPEGYKAEVEPDKLWFSGRVGERLGFRLTLRWLGVDDGKLYGNETSWEEQQKVKKDWWVGGVITWREEDGRNRVESPIAVFSSNTVQ
ncbi:subtilisin-like protease SBT1.5 [Elaeis guineensis]|uniref:Subtilisin-like protease SBT1.5 n=1 Tax=Elaeis guineensis var. tenera TaxID=51953 RepID=A0A6I9QRS0_ELAGV|nr:subtilisin-like protease SBT1.5 [Elaeis guineensis]